MANFSDNRSHLWNKEVCAIVITHNPDEKLVDLLRELEGQVDHTIIVDNASSAASTETIAKATQFPNVTLIENFENLGVASALNKGLEKTIMLGYQWAITFDQDSKPAPDMVEKLWVTLLCNIDEHKIGIIAPQIIDRITGRKSPFLQRRFHCIFQRSQCEGSVLENVTTVITTGALVNLSAFKALNGFRDDFFIDYVDTEFCLRLLQNGYSIHVSCEAELLHTFGNRRRKNWGPFVLYPSFHPPLRWYTISRNRIQMIKSYGFRIPHWLLYELVATSYILIRMILTEDERLNKLSALVKGTWDGLRGRMGRPLLAFADVGKSELTPYN